MQIRKISEEHYHYEYSNEHYFCCDSSNHFWNCAICSLPAKIVLIRKGNGAICEKCWNEQQKKEFNLMKMKMLLEK